MPVFCIHQKHMTTVRKRAASKPAIAPAPEQQQPADGIPIIFDEENGEATVTLENGLSYTLKEPPAKQFIYYTSWIETAPKAQQSNTMSAFWLSHAMICRIVDQYGQTVPKPDFDTFLDSLADGDIERVGAAFKMFPNVLDRYARIFANMVASSGATVHSQPIT